MPGQRWPNPVCEVSIDLSQPMAADQALHASARLLESRIVQVTHPRYLGLFNPRVRVGVAVVSRTGGGIRPPAV
jgi:hypothetical protein